MKVDNITLMMFVLNFVEFCFILELIYSSLEDALARDAQSPFTVVLMFVCLYLCDDLYKCTSYMVLGSLPK